MRALAPLLVLLAVMMQPPAALAHASLLSADPADGSTASAPPAQLRLDFNEPVSPLVLRLIGPDGASTGLSATAADKVVTVAAPPITAEGTYVLSWRVVSADGHPVGGTVVFSVGRASAGMPPAPAESNQALSAAIWLAKFALYVALFVGVGGAAFAAWTTDAPSRPGQRVYATAMAVGLFAVVVSLPLQGLDALAQPLTAIWRPQVWGAGFATAYGTTALVAVCVLILGFLLLRTAGRSARALAGLAIAGIGLALAVSGHASNAEPHWLTKPSVFLHGVCVAFWIGALVPLLLSVRTADRGALDRFSRAIPVPLAILVISGVTLCCVQLDRVDALWTTDYGLVLSAKLAAVCALLMLAAANRYVLVPRLAGRGAAMLRCSIVAELALALSILALVALWRFTPPPRALAASETTYIHFHDPRAMAEIDLTPQRGRGADVAIAVTDSDFRPVAAKEVAVAIWNPAAGIEPLRRRATDTGGGHWRIEDFRVPVAGVWRMRAEILVSDFDKVMIEDNVVLPRTP